MINWKVDVLGKHMKCCKVLETFVLVLVEKHKIVQYMGHQGNIKICTKDPLYGSTKQFKGSTATGAAHRGNFKVVKLVVPLET
jgi:hypothetical protein